MTHEELMRLADRYADSLAYRSQGSADVTRDALASALAEVCRDAERWRKALSSYERGIEMSYDGRTGEVDGYISLFLQAIRERAAAMKERCAKVCESQEGDALIKAITKGCAAAIRALKESDE